MDIVTLALAKQYTKKSLSGSGALKGDKGDPFIYDDFTPEQLEALKGDKGDPFTYNDFTPEQLASLKGPKGDKLTFEDLSDADKESLKGDKGDPFTYDDFTPTQLANLQGPKGDKLTFEDLTNDEIESLRGPKGDNYTITNKDYEAIAEKVAVPTKISELNNDTNFINDIRINGTSVSNVDGTVDLTLNSTIDENLICNKTIGGIAAGTNFAAGTPVTQIIKLLLNQPIIEDNGALYYGLSKDIPSSIDGLTPVEIDRDTLLNNGYVYKNINTQNQRVILAIPKSLGLVCYEINVSGFGIGFNEVETDKYRIYYDNLSTGNYRYTYKFEEA